MAKIIKGADVAAALKAELIKTIADNNLKPTLAVVQVGNDESNAAYERGIAKTCDAVGIEFRKIGLPEDISQEELEAEFIKINENREIHGILMFRPLPRHLDERRIAQLIDPEKDMDCMSPVNWAHLAMGEKEGYFPCTAEAVLQICDYAGIDLNGARAVVLGRSQVIGRPVGMMLLSRNATVTWCHSKTKDIAAMCKGANVLISACGVAKMVDESIAEGLAENAAAIDVGINFIDGKMCGDFDFEAVEKYAGCITPVPGGVGAVTSTIMASHVVKAALKAK